MSRTFLRNPVTDQWVGICSGPARLRYLHLFNADPESVAHVALAVKDTSITELEKPANGAVAPTGNNGSISYEYFVTAINANGETDPLEIEAISDGSSVLDENNYHTVSWDAVPDSTAYAVYVRESGTLWKRKLVESGTSVVNDGTWNVAYPPSWLNMTAINCLLDHEQLASGSILQVTYDAEIAADEAIVFATTNSLVHLLARYTEVE